MLGRWTWGCAVLALFLGQAPLEAQHHLHGSLHGHIGLHHGHFAHGHLGVGWGHAGLRHLGYGHHFGWGYAHHWRRHYYYPRYVGWGVGYYPLYAAFYDPWYGTCGLPYYGSGIFFQSTVISPIWLGRAGGVHRAGGLARPQLAAVAAPAAPNADAAAMVDFLKAHQRGRQGLGRVEKPAPGALVAALERALERRNVPAAGQRLSPREAGDAAFRQTEYAVALEHYDRALRRDPNVATWLRKSFALAALKRYGEAAEALRKAADHGGIRLRREDCPLDKLFRDREDKTRQLDQLAQAALEKPDDAGRLLLVGAFLLFDGQPDRARKFFDRAAIVGPPEQLAVAQTLKHVR